MEFPNSVLLTSLGSSNSQALHKILRHRFPQVKIYATDTSKAKEIPNLKGIAGFRSVPSGIDDHYKAAILQYCTEQEIKLVIPVHDNEVLAISAITENLEEIGTSTILPRNEILKTIRDKYAFAQAASERDIPLIPTSESPSFEFPMFIKPRIGNGSIDCNEIRDEQELDFYSRRISNPIFQPLIVGSKVIVDFTADRNSSITSLLARKELKTVAGNGTMVEIVENDELSKSTREVVKKLGFIGLGNVEFFVTKDRVYLIELNPRASSGIIFSYLAGVDILGHLFNIDLERKIEIRDSQPSYGKTLHRVFHEVEGSL